MPRIYASGPGRSVSPHFAVIKEFVVEAVTFLKLADKGVIKEF